MSINKSESDGKERNKIDQHEEKILSDGQTSPVFELIGDTPLMPPLVRSSVKVHMKPEWHNPGRSMKDRMVAGILRQAAREDELEGITHLVEGSSGNTGIALSWIGNALGYEVTITVPENTSTTKKRTIEAHGATLRECPDVSSGHPDHYRNAAARIAENEPEAFLLDQYHTERNPRAHYESLGPEIWQQAGEFMTHLFAPMGTGGTLSGTAKFLKEQNPDLTVIGVDGKKSNISNAFYDRDKTTYDCPVEGLGKNDQKPPMWFDYIDEIVDVDADDAFETARRLARTQGLFLGGSAAATVRAIDEYSFEQSAEIVAIAPDSGYKYLDSIYGE